MNFRVNHNRRQAHCVIHIKVRLRDKRSLKTKRHLSLVYKAKPRPTYIDGKTVLWVMKNKCLLTAFVQIMA